MDLKISIKMGMRKKSVEMEPAGCRYLVLDYIQYQLTRAGKFWNEGPALLPKPPKLNTAMRRMGDELEEQYKSNFEQLFEQLQIQRDSAYPTFTTAVEELFNGGINWGRVVALFVFSGILAKRFHDAGYRELLYSLADWTTTYIEHNLNDWIRNHGGWVCIICSSLFFVFEYIYSSPFIKLVGEFLYLVIISTMS